MQEYQIVKTSDYSIFKFVVSNREVDEYHVKDLVKKISRRNLLHIRPILCDAKMRVIDGQHRLEAAKILGTHIYYIQDPDLVAEDISVLNSSQKNWSMMDFVTFYEREGKRDFKQFVKLCNEYNLLAPSFLLRQVGSSNNVNVKNGSINLSHVDRVELRCSQLYRIHSVCTSKVTKGIIVKTFFAQAFMSIIDTKDEFDKLLSVCNTIESRASISEYIDQICFLINKYNPNAAK